MIAAALAGSSFAQDAATADPAQTVASEPASATTLQSAYKDHFLVGVAINRSIATGQRGRRGPEQVEKDIALVKEQFNQIVAGERHEVAAHPSAGRRGRLRLRPGRRLREFGLSNNMHIVGHTLVWHSQTPNWVFAGTNPPPPAAPTPR